MVIIVMCLLMCDEADFKMDLNGNGIWTTQVLMWPNPKVSSSFD